MIIISLDVYLCLNVSHILSVTHVYKVVFNKSLGNPSGRLCPIQNKFVNSVPILSPATLPPSKSIVS